MKDIARMAETTTASVSRALGNKPGVGPKLKKRILEIVARTGYRPNLVAQNLALNRSFTLGISVADLSNSLYVGLIRCIQMRTAKYGYQVVILDANQDTDRESQNIQWLRQNGVDGLVVIPAHDYKGLESIDHLLKLKSDRIPAVVMSDAVGKTLNCVTNEEIESSRTLVRHFLELGHRQFAFISFLGYENRCVVERVNGTRQELASAGLILKDEDVIFLREETWHEQEADLMSGKNRPTAIIAADNMLGLMVSQDFIRMGISVPKDVSIGTFGRSFPTLVSSPSLTSCSENWEEISRLTVKILLQQIDEGTNGSPKQYLVPQELVVRESSAKCPSRIKRFNL